MTRSQALIALLTLTAPLAGLERIGYRYTLAGDPRRNVDVIKRDLARAYIEWRQHAHAETSTVVSVRRQRGRASVTRLARWERTGTS